MDCEMTGNNEMNISNESCSQWPEGVSECGTCDNIVKKNNDSEQTSDVKGNVAETMLMLGSTSLLATPEYKQLNRRFTLRPRKCTSKDIGSNLRKVMKRTLKNNCKFLKQQQLETIFEEPVVTKQGEVVFIGLSKAKRSITFSQFVSKAKLKKRRSKIKKMKEKRMADKKRMEDVESKLWKLGL